KRVSQPRIRCLYRGAWPYFLVALFAFAATFSVFAAACFLLWRATALATSSAESLLCFSECNTSVSGPEFVAIAYSFTFLSIDCSPANSETSVVGHRI